MLRYYRNTIIKLVSKLRLLEQDTENLELLVEIQEEISKKIKYVESRISKCKKETRNLKADLRQKRLSKELTSEIKERRQVLNEQIEEYQWLLFVFRTIGDGIAFLYLDKWDIRPLAYKSATPDFKETSGYISGKVGAKGERLMVSVGATHGVPVLRTDLTNSIRYGDICFLGGPKPKLLELKSSHNKNARVHRQIKELAKIQAYLDDDYSFGLRGFPLINRVNILTPEVTYVETLNELIDKALQKSYVYRQVEPGVIYYIQTANTKPQFQKFGERLQNPIFYYLNTHKNDGDWINYYPFTLSIERPENVYLFLEGEIQIIIFVDISAIKSIAIEKGFEAEIVDEPGWVLEFKKESPIDKGTFCKISRHYLDRVAFEFCSLRWLLDQALGEYTERI